MAEMIKSDYDLNNRRSKDRLEDAINHLAGFFAGRRAIDITGASITAYAEDRHKEEGAALGTVHNELAALRRMFTLEIRAGSMCQRPAFPTISLNNARKGFFEENEFCAVLEHLPQLDRPPVEFAYYTGWRKNEILKLQWPQVDFQAGIMRLEVGSTKNDEGRTFPFVALPALQDLLERQRAYTDEVELATGKRVVWVFHRNGEPIKSLKKAWKAESHFPLPGRRFIASARS
jgi:integrase